MDRRGVPRVPLTRIAKRSLGGAFCLRRACRGLFLGPFPPNAAAISPKLGDASPGLDLVSPKPGAVSPGLRPLSPTLVPVSPRPGEARMIRGEAGMVFGKTRTGRSLTRIRGSYERISGSLTWIKTIPDTDSDILTRTVRSAARIGTSLTWMKASLIRPKAIPDRPARIREATGPFQIEKRIIRNKKIFQAGDRRELLRSEPEIAVRTMVHHVG